MRFRCRSRRTSDEIAGGRKRPLEHLTHCGHSERLLITESGAAVLDAVRRGDPKQTSRRSVSGNFGYTGARDFSHCASADFHQARPFFGPRARLLEGATCPQHGGVVEMATDYLEADWKSI